jgi:hypothetical protein
MGHDGDQRKPRVTVDGALVRHRVIGRAPHGKHEAGEAAERQGAVPLQEP